MSDVKLFCIENGKATELQGSASDLEKPLQTLIENNLEALLNIRFLATEYFTGKLHGGRIDSLGLDEDGCPVILEYKRSVGENVINQGLFYLDWLMDHQGEFKLLVMEKLGKPVADAIDWSAPRVICIASDFTKYDSHAVQQIGRNIELVRYRRFGDGLLLLEQASTGNSGNSKNGAAKSGKSAPAIALEEESEPLESAGGAKPGADKTYAEWMQTLSPALLELLDSLESYLFSLGDDVQRKQLKLYAAFKRLKNFATVVPKKSCLLLYLHLDPADWVGQLPNAADMSKKGHWGTGDLEIRLFSLADLDAAKRAIVQAYEGKVVPA